MSLHSLIDSPANGTGPNEVSNELQERETELKVQLEEWKLDLRETQAGKGMTEKQEESYLPLELGEESVCDPGLVPSLPLGSGHAAAGHH